MNGKFLTLFKNNIEKILNIVFIIFVLVLIIFNCTDFLIILLSILLLYLLVKKKINNKLFYVLVILGILIRICTLFIHYDNFYSDYSFNFDSAVSFATDFQFPKNVESTKNYFALFPYLFSYVFSLGTIMKIFGTGKISIVISNLIFEAIGFIYYYKLSKKHSKDHIKELSLIYILNPINIIWNMLPYPLIITNSIFIICIYYLDKLKDKKTKKEIILFSIISGIVLSILNSFRPIAIILIIALFMYIIIDYFKTKQIKINAIKFSIVIISFLLTNTLINTLITNKIDTEIATTKGGWSIYLGSNYESYGMWNLEDSTYLFTIYENNTADETQKIMQEEGINRYIENGFKNIRLLIHKAHILGYNFDSYTYYTLFEQASINNSILQFIIKLSLSLYLYLILFLNLYLVWKKKLNILPIPIYSFGLFVASLLVEVSPRYFYPVIVAFIINTISLYKKDTKD